VSLPWNDREIHAKNGGTAVYGYFLMISIFFTRRVVEINRPLVTSNLFFVWGAEGWVQAQHAHYTSRDKEFTLQGLNYLGGSIVRSYERRMKVDLECNNVLRDEG
jgi:hypothetical protein